MGDSLSFEHFLATVCALSWGVPNGSALPTPSLSSMPGLPHWCVAFRAGTAACVVSCGQKDLVNRQCSETLKRMLSARWVGPNDTLVVNIGLHIDLQALAGEVSTFLSVHAAVPNQSRPLLLWRETAAQHFPNTAHGLYASGGSTTTVEAAGSTANCSANFVHEARWVHKVGDAVQTHDIDNRSQAGDEEHNVYNRISNPLVQREGVPIIAVWHDSLLHSERKHFGRTQAFQRTPSGVQLSNRSVLDCTHFCLGSGVVEHWVERMARLIWTARDKNVHITLL